MALSKNSRIDRSEYFLELPLDSDSDKALRRINPALPRWDSVRGLTPALNREFPEIARQEEKRRHLARIHLDVLSWGQRGIAD